MSHSGSAPACAADSLRADWWRVMLPNAREPLALIALTPWCVVIAVTMAPMAPASAAARCLAWDEWDE